jgi:hypothetical protein
MGKVVNIRRALIEAAARELEPEMRDRGQVVRTVDALGDLTVAEWRRAAVIAGHRCGSLVVTRSSPAGDAVIAVATTDVRDSSAP